MEFQMSEESCSDFYDFIVTLQVMLRRAGIDRDAGVLHLFLVLFVFELFWWLNFFKWRVGVECVNDVWLPDHDLKKKKEKNKLKSQLSWKNTHVTIAAASDEELAVLAELDSSYAALMTFESVNVSSFEQVQDLGESIVAASNHEVAAGMEVQAVHASIEDSIVLDEFAHFQVEDLDSWILLSDGDEVVVSMPAQLVPEALLILKSVDQLAGISVEDPQSFVLATRSDHFVVGRESSTSYPVSVTVVGVDEVAMRKAEHLDRFVIWSRDEAISAVWEVDRPNRLLVSHNLFRVPVVHYGLEDVDTSTPATACNHVLSGPVNRVHFILLLKLQAAQVFMINRVDGDRSI